MPIKLEEKTWKAFYIGGKNGLFDISSSTSGIDKGKIPVIEREDTSRIPYITRSNLENGYSFFVHNLQEYDYNTDEGGVMTIGLDTQTIFFQPHRFYTGQNIQVLRHKNLNKFTAAFLIPLLKIQMQKFSWGGNGATLGRLFKTKIMLPVNNQGQPDWLFMENYIKEIQQIKKDTYKMYATKSYNKLSYKKVPTLAEKTWKAFFVEEIAEILPGKDIYEKERIKGSKPYISSTAQNNGVGYFVGNHNGTLDKNCISVNRNGSIGYSFFHPYKALFSNDCRTLKIKSTHKYANYFIATQITKQREKYNYGHKMGTARLKRQKILLPINEEGEPDYDYMSQYMMNIEIKKRQQYFYYQMNK